MHQPTVFCARWIVPSAGLGPDAGTPEHWDEDVQDGERARNSGASGVTPTSPFSYPVMQTRASSHGPALISGLLYIYSTLPTWKSLFHLARDSLKLTSLMAPNPNTWGLAGSPLQAPSTAFLTPLWPTVPVIHRTASGQRFRSSV